MLDAKCREIKDENFGMGTLWAPSNMPFGFFQRRGRAGQRGALVSDSQLIELPRVDLQSDPAWRRSWAGTTGSKCNIARGWPNMEIGG